MITPLFLAPLSLSLLAGNTFTVDDDGPADFASVALAVGSAAVTDGDLLIVEPGSYAGFTLGKGLTITGRAGAARPTLTSKVSIDSAPRFELVRLVIPGLQVQFVPGAATIEDCVITGTTSQKIGLLVNHCPQLTLSRSVVQGLSPASGEGGVGLLSVLSCVVLSGAEISGGAGGAGSSDGGTAVRALQACDLLFAGGSLMGGAAGSSGGKAGHGLHLVSSLARVRGSVFDVVLPGAPGAGSPGKSFQLQDKSTLVLGPVVSSGIGESGPPSTVVFPAQPEPYLRLTGSNGLGTTGSIDLFGPPGAIAMLAIGEFELVTPVHELDGDLWIDPNALLFVGFLVTSGNLFPTPCPYAIPVSSVLVGRSFRGQTMFPGAPGALDPTKRAISNPIDIIIRP